MAFSGLQKTRLGLAAFARRLYGSFAGKSVTVSVFTTLDLQTTISQQQVQAFTQIDAGGVNIDQNLNGTVGLDTGISLKQTQMLAGITSAQVDLETIID